MRFLLLIITLFSFPSLAFYCPAGAHLCSRFTHYGPRHLCVQFDKTKVSGIDDTPRRYAEWEFKHERHWSRCLMFSSEECVDQWVKVTDSRVRAYKYTVEADIGTSYEYLEMNLKTNTATLSYSWIGRLADTRDPEFVTEYSCKSLKQAYFDASKDLIGEPGFENACGPLLNR